MWCLVAAASMVGGCADIDDGQPIPGMPISVEASGNSSTAATTSAPTPESLPPCGEMGSATTPPDCRLQSRDPVGATFEVRRAARGGKTTVAIDVIGPDGVRTQTLTERDVQHPSDPTLRDVDGDGRDELLVPVYLATANTRYVVYHASGDATEYQRAGELVGIGIDTTTDGYVVSPMRDGYSSWDIGFWRISDDTLVPIVTAQVRLRYTDDGDPDGSECTVIDAGGLHATGLASLEAAQDHFCAEPAVQRVMRR